jgi:sulfite exporter TauE/SafE/copper chaperone CopZ
MDMGERMDGTNEPTTLTVDIEGMHCPNCETIIELRFKTLTGVQAVVAHNPSCTATVTHDGSVDIPALQQSLGDEEYRVVPAGEGRKRNSPRDYAEIAGAFVIFVALWLGLRQLNLIPERLGVSEDTTYGLAFLIGLVASVSTCMAVTGGLLVALAAKYNNATGAMPGRERLKPLIYFNAGRIIAYTLFGAVIGALGSAFTLSPGASGILTLVVSGLMILLGLQMLRLLPAFGRLMPNTSKKFSHWLHDIAAKDVKEGAFLLGAATFFLPCGFTQALQLYVLASGSPLTGALTMLAFALGALPALMSLSAVSSFARGGFQRHFLRFAGAAVIVLGVLNIQYGLTLANANMRDVVASAAPPPEIIGQTPIPQQGAQVLNMTVSGFEYSPNRFTIAEGSPVEWHIDGAAAAGCGRVLIAPGLGVRQLLEHGGETIIRFTAPAPGEYAFNCGMGMMTENSAITVVPHG